jgi:hypothetical protein
VPISCSNTVWIKHTLPLPQNSGGLASVHRYYHGIMVFSISHCENSLSNTYYDMDVIDVIAAEQENCTNRSLSSSFRHCVTIGSKV